MKARTLGALASLAMIVGLPSVSSAAPMSWNYSGVCLAGDCSDVPSITGSLVGDPTLFGSPGELNEYVVLGDLFSYSFNIGSYQFNGTRGSGSYTLDAGGNIVGGTMTFGDLVSLEFLDVGSATWHIKDTDCKLIFICRTDTEAWGSGGYTTTRVPEPASLGLLGMGLLAAGAALRRKARV